MATDQIDFRRIAMLAFLVATGLTELGSVGEGDVSALFVPMTLYGVHTLAVCAANVLLILGGAFKIGMTTNPFEIFKSALTGFHI